MTDHLERAFAFLRRGDVRGTSEQPFRFGTAIFTPELPRRYDSNLLYVDRPVAAAAELEAEADRLFDEAGLGTARCCSATRPRASGSPPSCRGWDGRTSTWSWRQLARARRRRGHDAASPRSATRASARRAARMIADLRAGATPRSPSSCSTTRRCWPTGSACAASACSLDGEIVSYARPLRRTGRRADRGRRHAARAPRPRLREGSRDASRRRGARGRRRLRLPRRRRARLAEGALRTGSASTWSAATSSCSLQLRSSIVSDRGGDIGCAPSG